jgi:hypothetical protein
VARSDRWFSVEAAREAVETFEITQWIGRNRQILVFYPWSEKEEWQIRKGICLKCWGREIVLGLDRIVYHARFE